MTRTDELRVTGPTILNGSFACSPGVPRTELAQEDAMEHPVDLGSLKISTTGQPLTATASGSDLALISGTFGTANQYVQGRDCKTATITGYARFLVAIPPNYVAGQSVKLRFAAGMITAVSDTTATIDCEAYLVGRTTLKSGSDLCATSATSINSLTFADKDFTITATALLPGDVLDVRVTLAVVDAAGASAVKPTIAAIDLITSIKG